MLTLTHADTVRREHYPRDRFEARERDPLVAVGQGTRDGLPLITHLCSLSLTVSQIQNDFMTKEEIDEVFARASKAKSAPKKTLEQEVSSGAADGFDPVSDSEDEEPVRKKAKKA